MELTLEDLVGMIDHTQLRAQATEEDIGRLADEAKRYHFRSVCVNPFWVSTASELVRGSDVGVVSVVGFPLGQSRTECKVEEGRMAVEDGATELDMVMNIGALKSQRFSYVENDIRDMTRLGVPVKVIIESCYLFPEEKIMACELAMRAGAQFIKTSTGFGAYGATRDDVMVIRHVVGDRMKIKAAGGISNWQKAKDMIDAGVDRIGASKSVEIVDGFKASQ
ncbi:MAG TPA: deoxyribose-phosphate aldolase [Candidatus Methanofastidiosa archaeon]|nr:deoxyribose-phosphate aldolase [Candidatus Methanofastidiosa archaeon]